MNIYFSVFTRTVHNMAVWPTHYPGQLLHVHCQVVKGRVLGLGRVNPQSSPTTNFVYDQTLAVAAIPLYEQTRLNLVVTPIKTVTQLSPRLPFPLLVRPPPHPRASMVMSF